MSVLIFIVVIVGLVLVHELGHFIAAKVSGMRVDEFGIGFPPRAGVLGVRHGTVYSLNWLPLGGFVKIFGEDGSDARDPRAFGARPRILQAFVLIAGVLMNFIFAYFFLTAALMLGTPRALSDADQAIAQNPHMIVASVVSGSPASEAGLQPGDTISRVSSGASAWSGSDAEGFTAFVRSAGAVPLTVTVKHDSAQKEIVVTPRKGIVPGNAERVAIGVEVATVGTVRLSLGSALVEGARLTWATTVLTAKGLVIFLYQAITLRADFSQVAGPVGIASAVGSANLEGPGALFSLIALISINLALINLLPLPALDGGRLLFVIIESIMRRPISVRITQGIHSVGYALLLLLMVVVTLHDITKIGK